MPLPPNTVETAGAEMARDVDRPAQGGQRKQGVGGLGTGGCMFPERVGCANVWAREDAFFLHMWGVGMSGHRRMHVSSTRGVSEGLGTGGCMFPARVGCGDV